MKIKEFKKYLFIIPVFMGMFFLIKVVSQEIVKISKVRIQPTESLPENYSVVIVKNYLLKEGINISEPIHCSTPEKKQMSKENSIAFYWFIACEHVNEINDLIVSTEKKVYILPEISINMI